MSQRIHRRQALSFGLATTASLLMPVGARAATKMRFVTPFNFSLSYSSVFYAKVGGFFDKEGLEVEVINGKGAATAAQLVIAGQAEVARTGGANYIQAKVDSDAPLVSIATIAQGSPFFMVSSPKAPLRSSADLVGKTIGVASLGGSMEGTLNLMLRAGSVAADKVERVRVADVPASYGLIEAGRIHGFMASISSVVKIMSAVQGVVTFPIDDGLPGQVYVAAPKALEANKDSYVRFLRAERKAALAILDATDLKPIVQAIDKGGFEIPGLSNVDDAVLDLKQNAQTWVSKGRDNILRNVPDQWAAAVKVMAETGMIKREVDAATLYTNAIIDQAAQG